MGWDRMGWDGIPRVQPDLSTAGTLAVLLSLSRCYRTAFSEWMGRLPIFSE